MVKREADQVDNLTAGLATLLRRAGNSPATVTAGDGYITVHFTNQAPRMFKANGPTVQTLAKQGWTETTQGWKFTDVTPQPKARKAKSRAVKGPANDR